MVAAGVAGFEQPTQEGHLINAALTEALLHSGRRAPAAGGRLQDPLAVHACLSVSHLLCTLWLRRVRTAAEQRGNAVPFTRVRHNTMP